MLRNNSVWNSRPLDVHRWSEFPSVNDFVSLLWDRYILDNDLSVPSNRGRSSNQSPKNQFKVLLLDLYVCWTEDPDKYIGISLGNKHWKPTSRYNSLHLSKKIKLFLVWLVSKGLVEHRPHWHSLESSVNNRSSRYRASDSLIQIFKCVGFCSHDIGVYEGRETVILKAVVESADLDDDQKSVPIEYEDTDYTRHIRSQLSKYNALLNETHVDIATLEEPIVKFVIRRGNRKGQSTTLQINQSNKFVRRIFSRGSWECHGRIYGGWWQQVSSDIRSRIFINGNPTVEVDFKAMHISLLNAQTGAAVVYDPYKVSSDVFPEVDRGTVRSWNKSLVLAAINAKDRKSAYGAFRKNAPTGSAEKRLKDLQLSRLLDAFIANNPHLTEFVCSDQGIKLMNKDSHIAADIIGTLTAKKIPVLTIHDSFIVERHHFAELRLAMIEASLKHCRRNLIAEQDGFTVDFSDGLNMHWSVINEQAVNKLPTHHPCPQYLDRLKRFCDAAGVVQVKNNKGRGLMARYVISLRRIIEKCTNADTKHVS